MADGEDEAAACLWEGSGGGDVGDGGGTVVGLGGLVVWREGGSPRCLKEAEGVLEEGDRRVLMGGGDARAWW